jgi:FkbM family methyltransferase
MPSEASIVEFRTPGGRLAQYWYRPDTTDWNTVASCCAEDEYGIPQGLAGWAADIGAHIGGATIAMLLDNPAMRCIAVEPLDENVAYLSANAGLNGVSDRLVVIPRAAAGTDVVRYGYTDSESSIAHRYIGNMSGQTDAPGLEVRVRRLFLEDLLEIAGGYLSFVKTDCEGGEYALFDSPRIGDVGLISGEWHETLGHDLPELVALLDATHVVTSTTGVGGGGFRAIPR